MIRIHTFDVGHGSCHLMRFPNGTLGLFDCCISPGSFNLSTLNNKLHKYVNDGDRLRFICLSHFDEDHYLGMSKVLELYGHTVEAFICPDFSHRWAAHLLLLVQKGKGAIERLLQDELSVIEDKVDSPPFPQKSANVSKEFPIEFGNLQIMYLAPDDEDLGRMRAKIRRSRNKILTGASVSRKSFFNDVSIVLAIKYHKALIVFTADKLTHKRWLPRLKNRGVNWLEVPHHGSEKNATNELLSRLALPKRKTVYVISGSGGNNHPGRRVLMTCKKLGHVYCTRLSIHCAKSLKAQLRKRKLTESILHIARRDPRWALLQSWNATRSKKLLLACRGHMTFEIASTGRVYLTDPQSCAWSCPNLR